jgi:hypothetical protein
MKIGQIVNIRDLKGVVVKYKIIAFEGEAWPRWGVRWEGQDDDLCYYSPQEVTTFITKQHMVLPEELFIL